MAIITNYLGDNSIRISIPANSDRLELIQAITNFLSSRGWTRFNDKLEFRCLNEDNLTYKYARILTMPDPENAGIEIATIVPFDENDVLGYSPTYSPQSRINWFRFSGNIAIEIWVMCSARWFLMGSRSGSVYGAGISSSMASYSATSGDIAFRITTNRSDRSLKDNPLPYELDKDSDWTSQYSTVYRNNSRSYISTETGYYYRYNWNYVPYYDTVNMPRFRGGYSNVRGIQGCIEVKKDFETNNFMKDLLPSNTWFSSPHMGNSFKNLDGLVEGETKKWLGMMDQLRIGSGEPRTLLDTVGGIHRTLNHLGNEVTNQELCAVSLYDDLVSYSLGEKSRANVKSDFNGKNFVQEISVKTGVGTRLGKLHGIKLLQADTDLPFGTVVQLRVNSNFELDTNGRLMPFIVFPGYVERQIQELTRRFVYFGGLTRIYDSNQNNKGTYHTNGWSSYYNYYDMYGRWMYFYDTYNTSAYMSLLIPA